MKRVVSEFPSETKRLCVVIPVHNEADNLAELVKRREQQAIDRINQAEAEATREVRNKAVEIAVSATGRLIADTMSADKANELIDAAIKELPNLLH